MNRRPRTYDEAFGDLCSDALVYVEDKELDWVREYINTVVQKRGHVVKEQRISPCYAIVRTPSAALKSTVKVSVSASVMLEP